ncbi:MAG: hypothetical protein IT576_05625 [Verrucomicrobiales bacterium]|nr:hypothetical protein [Verrucomicrobiales bacterium]
MTRLLIALVLFLASSAHAQSTDPGPFVEKALTAVGGREKLLKIFRMEEIFHFGNTPEPAEGKKRSTRVSVIEQPSLWWIGTKERAVEPAKDDVRAWSLDLLVDPKSVIEILPDLTDEGRICFGLQISGSVDPAMKCYFDKETNRLKRLDWRSDFYRFSDWREHNGLHYAAKTIIFKRKDDSPWFYHEILALERLAKLPEGLAKP